MLWMKGTPKLGFRLGCAIDFGALRIPDSAVIFIIPNISICGRSLKRKVTRNCKASQALMPAKIISCKKNKTLFFCYLYSSHVTGAFLLFTASDIAQ